MSGPRMGNMGQLNGNRRPNLSRMPSNDRPMPSLMPVITQHDDLIRYIYDSWSKVEMDRGTTSVRYYQEHENHNLKDFRPFDLEAYWGRRMHQNHQNIQRHS